ncbi:MAG TPA: enoyl-CoA hydratase [Candidatus Nanopelagicaceae bacterium]
MDEILTSRDVDLVTITLNRPSKMNAITRAMYAELVRHLREAAGDFGVRAVVIRAEGTNFTAGNDIYDFMDAPPAGPEAEGFQFLQELHNFPKSIVAIVQGNAIGIGTTMLLHCDAVFATPNAQFSMPFVSLGLVPEAGSSFLFPSLVGHQRAAYYFLTGESFDAQTAREMGLVIHVGDDAQEKGMQCAKRIAAQPPTAVINTKALLKSRTHDAVAAVMGVEGELFRLALQSDEAREAFMKFISKGEKK